MNKKIVALLSAALMVAAPAAAMAWESPSGAVKAETITVATQSGVSVRAAAACNGTGSLVIEEAPEGVRASNTEVAEGYTEIGSFKITSTGQVEPPFQFAYNLGAAYANADVTIFVDHETEGVENEVIKKTASSDGTVTFTTNALSIHTIVAKQSDSKPATDTGSKSPQTGLATAAIAGASVVALGSAAVLRKKVSE